MCTATSPYGMAAGSARTSSRGFPGRPGSQFPVMRIDHLDVITIQESSRQWQYFPQRPP